MDWRSIRNLGRVKYFGLSYVVLIGVPLLAELTLAIRRVTAASYWLLFPITLKFLFLASLFYAVAVALYQFFCPPEIKQHESKDVFVDALQPLYERAHPDRKLEVVLAQLTKSEESTRLSLEALQAQGPGAQGELQELLTSLYPSAVQRFLIGTYRRQLRARSWAIYIAAACYLLGTAVMVYFLIHRAVAVLEV